MSEEPQEIRQLGVRDLDISDKIHLLQFFFGMSFFLRSFRESYCSSWSCICFSSSVGVVVLTVTVKFLGLGGGGGGPLTVKYQLFLRGGGGGGCFLFLLFWGTPKTWTYAMLTCIVYRFTLLYS